MDLTVFQFCCLSRYPQRFLKCLISSSVKTSFHSINPFINSKIINNMRISSVLSRLGVANSAASIPLARSWGGGGCRIGFGVAGVIEWSVDLVEKETREAGVCLSGGCCVLEFGAKLSEFQCFLKTFFRQSFCSTLF